MPFYLRTGKSLAEGRRTVTIGFTEAPLGIFPNQPEDRTVRPSELVFELSDDPQVRIEVEAKIPGPVINLGRAAFTLDVDAAFDGHDGLEAYERLLHDVMLRERLLFTRSEQIERLWEVCAPVLENPPEPLPYAEGTWGPEAALELPRRTRLAPARRRVRRPMDAVYPARGHEHRNRRTPDGWVAETLRDGAVTLVIDDGGLDAINAAARALDQVAVSVLRRESGPEAQEAGGDRPSPARCRSSGSAPSSASGCGPGRTSAGR